MEEKYFFQYSRAKSNHEILTFCINAFIAGVKKSAPDPKPAITTPDARPRLSGNHSINA